MALCAARLEHSQGTCFVSLHHTAIADDIGRENGGKPALDAFFGHMLPLRLKTPLQQIVVALLRGVYRTQLPDWVNSASPAPSARGRLYPW